QISAADKAGVTLDAGDGVFARDGAKAFLVARIWLLRYQSKTNYQLRVGSHSPVFLSKRLASDDRAHLRCDQSPAFAALVAAFQQHDHRNHLRLLFSPYPEAR